MVRLGICPICGFDRMIMVSDDACPFDACPKCGFGYGFLSNRGRREKLRNKELWDRILADHVVFSLTDSEDLTREKILSKVSAFDPAAVQRARRETGSVFKYGDKEIVENAHCVSVLLGLTGLQIQSSAHRWNC